MISYNIFKRFFDIFVSILLFIATFPILILAILAITISCKTSPFYWQKRPGKNSLIFSIVKLKTMNEKKDLKGNLLSDKQRLTTIGKIVRKLSIDELPQLINVLKGDMSLIGPRPLLPEYLDYYTSEQARRHNVRPGITGWAQVNGRNSLSWEQKFKLDVWYVDNVSFTLDFKIFWLTILKIVRREGINSDTSATMERFDHLQKNKEQCTYTELADTLK